MKKEIDYFNYDRTIYGALAETSKAKTSRFVSIKLENLTKIPENKDPKKLSEFQIGNTLIFRFRDLTICDIDIENILRVHTPLGATNYRIKTEAIGQVYGETRIDFYRILPKNPYVHLVG